MLVIFLAQQVGARGLASESMYPAIFCQLRMVDLSGQVWEIWTMRVIRFRHIASDLISSITVDTSNGTQDEAHHMVTISLKHYSLIYYYKMPVMDDPRASSGRNS